VGCSLDNSRISVAPRFDDEAFIGIASDKEQFAGDYLVLILAEIHEFTFSYNSLQHAHKQLDPSTEIASESDSPALRKFLGLATLTTLRNTMVPGINIGGKTLSGEQMAALTGVLTNQFAVVDCIAGSGKTLVLVAATKCLVDANQAQHGLPSAAPESDKKMPLVVLSVVNKSMIEPLLNRLEEAGLNMNCVTGAGVSNRPGHRYPVDLLAEWLGKVAKDLLQQHEALISKAHLVIQHLNIITCNDPRNWTVWNKLEMVHSLLHAFLDKVFYSCERAAHEEALKNIQVLVCSSSFLRKLLGRESCWSKTILNQFSLQQLLVDEAHHNGWQKSAAAAPCTL
jgi:hypothetical protein